MRNDCKLQQITQKKTQISKKKEKFPKTYREEAKKAKKKKKMMM